MPIELPKGGATLLGAVIGAPSLVRIEESLIVRDA
jgi:hypothetical protein